jgi:hypothetical protein
MGRRYWIEVFTSSGPLLGTDGTVPLDGRFGLERAISEGYQYIHRLRAVKPHASGFVISRGERPSSLTPISRPYHIS